MSLSVEQYLERVRPAELFARLKVGDADTLAANVAHFTEKEARDRDAIVLGHLGSDGAQRVVDAVVEGLLPAGAMNPQPALLDLGAGSGFFTHRVAEGLRARGLRPRLFAMDATPAMLRALGRKPFPIVPVLGLLEDVEGSVREAAKVQPLPALFDGAFSTLALHHCPDPPRFFEGAARVLGFGAPLVVVDLQEHRHEELRANARDLHLGFRPAQVEAWAAERFGEARAAPLEGTCCTDDGERIGLFALAARR
jgi:SAM-dependent methyltransferase